MLQGTNQVTFTNKLPMAGSNIKVLQTVHTHSTNNYNYDTSK